METQQQKRYFDHLLNLVIEEAPELLIKVDSHIGITDSETLNLKQHSEEFCWPRTIVQKGTPDSTGVHCEE